MVLVASSFPRPPMGQCLSLAVLVDSSAKVFLWECRRLWVGEDKVGGKTGRFMQSFPLFSPL